MPFLKHLKKIFSCFISVTSLAFLCASAYARDFSEASEVDTSFLRSNVEFLSGERCAGRACGTAGSFVCATWIARQFRSAGLEPLGDSWFHMADAGGRASRSVVGVRRSWHESSEYIVVGAHFDGLGSIDGRIYPGADSNASGVAVLLSLLKMVTRYPSVNIIFAAFDGYGSSFAGSGGLAGELSGKKVLLMVNLDMLGSTFSPLSERRKDYLIALGGSSRDVAFICANIYGLQLGFDYYGSANFTDIFYRKIGDQVPFLNSGIPSVVFTSGITMNTNRIEDTAETLDYGILLKRTDLISRWLNLKTSWR